jgi:hypothetical protein
MFWDRFTTFLHHHHANEEEIAFPYIASRTKLPERMTTDHATLVTLLEQVWVGWVWDAGGHCPLSGTCELLTLRCTAIIIIIVTGLESYTRCASRAHVVRL